MEELIKSAQNGNELAFKQLVEKMQNDLYRVAKVRLKNEEDIKDAIQNTMIITYKNLKKIRNIESFKTWIMKVLINECNKIYNAYKKNNEVINRASNEVQLDSYDESVYEAQAKINFDELIGKLKYNERIIITLYYNSQFSCSQIAKVLNMNIHTVKSKLNRSKMKLKKIFEEGKMYDL